MVLGDRGVLIRGPSGSGKTTLALTLIAWFQSHGRFARLVGDDQLFPTAQAVASWRAAAAIAGLSEIRGIGPRPLPFMTDAVIDLVARLVPEPEAPTPGGSR